jgi:putative flippase GtrA
VPGTATLPSRLSRLAQPLTFALIGAANTVLDVALFAALLGAGLAPVPANTVSYGSGILTSYVLNGRLTFRLGWAELASARKLGAFALTALTGLLISNLVVGLLAGPIGPMPAKLCSLLASFAWNYTLAKRFAFAHPGGPPREGG